MATIYLIHFSEAYRHARHCIGLTDDLDARLAAHAFGQGARLMSVINDAGITWRCVRTWQGDRGLERRLKNRKHSALLCPICSGERANQRGNYVNEKPRQMKKAARPASGAATEEFAF